MTLDPTIGSTLRGHHARLNTLESTSRPILNACWAADMPFEVGEDGAVWRVPYVKELSRTFTVVRVELRLEVPGSTTTTVRVERSPGGGAFSATTVAAVSCASGVYENDNVGTFLEVTSGQLLRIYFTAIGTGADQYVVQLEGITS